MAKVTTASRMTNAAWDMTTMAWGLHPCTLEAMVPCHVSGPAPGVSTDADSGKTQRRRCVVVSHLFFQADHVCNTSN